MLNQTLFLSPYSYDALENGLEISVSTTSLAAVRTSGLLLTNQRSSKLGLL
jgi:hypothetical protein